jgi:excinuclease ABC subunit C
MEFERAAEIRDTINSLNTLTEKQKVETGTDDRDFVAMARNENEALLQVFFMRGGKLSGREHYMMMAEEEDDDSDIIAAFVKQFYSEAAFIPKEIAVVSTQSEKASICAWLGKLAGRQVSIIIPQKGEKHKMLQLAQTNAELTMSQFGSHLKRENERNATALNELATALGLQSLDRIEAYDISNIQGYESVGSMVVFEKGKAKNSDYRKFKLRTVVGPDDYAGMEEVLSRRFKRYNESSHGFSRLPDVIFVDGGKGQVSAVEKAMLSQGVAIPVCGMVKDDKHRTRGLFFENNEISLPRTSEGFKMVVRLQDEVHRFALEYHRKLRADTQVRSVLDEIEGIGATRRKEMLKHFKSIEAIKAATFDELKNAPSMNKKSAEAVYNFFNLSEKENLS